MRAHDAPLASGAAEDDLSAAVMAERERERRWCEGVSRRYRFDVPLVPLHTLGAHELNRLGESAHEVGHAAAIIACGSVVDHIALRPETTSGPRGYARAVVPHTNVVASVAISLIGCEGYARATKHWSGAWGGGVGDRANIEATLERAGLAGRAADAVALVAEELVEFVIGDDTCFESIVDLALDLARRPSARMDGEELHSRLVVPYAVRARAARLIGEG